MFPLAWGIVASSGVAPRHSAHEESHCGSARDSRHTPADEAQKAVRVIRLRPCVDAGCVQECGASGHPAVVGLRLHASVEVEHEGADRSLDSNETCLEIEEVVSA